MVKLTLRHQAVHHPLHELDLVLDGKVDEVGVHQDSVRWAEVGVVRKEEADGVSALLGWVAAERADRCLSATHEDETCALLDVSGQEAQTRTKARTPAAAPPRPFPSPPSLLPSRRFPFCNNVSKHLPNRAASHRLSLSVAVVPTHSLGSEGLSMRFTAANLRVLVALPWAK